jgi:hypothetical protein
MKSTMLGVELFCSSSRMMFLLTRLLHSHISFYNDGNDSEFNLLVINDGGEHFFSNVNRTLTELENDNSATIKAKVQVVNGGEWLLQQDFAPSRSYFGLVDH